VRLAGGDLARNPGGTVATLTLLGTRPEQGRWLRRGDAAPGHGLWLGGSVGESAAGALLVGRGARLTGSRVTLPAALGGLGDLEVLAAAARRAVRRHLLPEPQLALGVWLGEQPAGAAMDVSDGLARDLHRLCRESGTGAEVDFESLPLSDRFVPLCERIGAGPRALALAGGEDYVLLFTLPKDAEPPSRFGCRRIGTITRRRNLVLIEQGTPRELADDGWDHLGK
jgi:thiamine-monophosphate kinase